VNETQSETPLAFRAVRGALWVAAGSYTTIVVGAVASLIMTRILLPQDFGIFALASFFFALANLSPKLGVGAALAQQPALDGRWLGSHLWIELTAGAGTLALAGVAAPVLLVIGYEVNVAWATVAIAAIGVAVCGSNTARLILDRQLNFRQTAVLEGVALPISYIPAVWLALNGAGYWSLVAQAAGQAAMLLAGCWWAARRTSPELWETRWRFDGAVARQMLRYGAPVGLAGIATIFVSQFDNFLVGTFSGLALLGYYDRAYRIAQWPGLLCTGIIGRAAFFTFARLQHDRKRLSTTAAMSVRLVALVALPLALAICLVAPELVPALYGDKWLGSVLLVQLLVVASIGRPLLELNNALFISIGRPGQATWVSNIQAATLAILGTPLTMLLGPAGTCVGVGAASIVALGVAYRYFRRTVSASLGKTLGPPIVAAALTATMFLVGRLYAGSPNAPLAVRLVMELAFVGASFFVLLLALERKALIEQCRYVWQLASGTRNSGGRLDG
jgi:lipopolysaccharide exporter